MFKFVTEHKLINDINKPYPNARGLSKLTSICFGKPLNKLECLSNWENKPLREVSWLLFFKFKFLCFNRA
jgi:hypothetical protein